MHSLQVGNLLRKRGQVTYPRSCSAPESGGKPSHPDFLSSAAPSLDYSLLIVGIIPLLLISRGGKLIVAEIYFSRTMVLHPSKALFSREQAHDPIVKYASEESLQSLDLSMLQTLMTSYNPPKNKMYYFLNFTDEENRVLHIT